MGDKITVPHILKMKQRGEKISCLTAYDYTFARILDEAGVDMLLVGDSLGWSCRAARTRSPSRWTRWSTTPRLVARGRKRALVVGDMPFMSYQVGSRRRRCATPAGCQGRRRRGGQARGRRRRAQTPSARIVEAGIPVMGHVGLTPQSVHRMGGYKVQGRDEAAARARCVRGRRRRSKQAGAFAVVLEGMPARLGRRDHRSGFDPDHRHRRRRALRRPGAGDARHARPRRRLRAEVRQALRRRRRPDRRGADSRLRRAKSRRAAFPDARATAYLGDGVGPDHPTSNDSRAADCHEIVDRSPRCELGAAGGGAGRRIVFVPTMGCLHDGHRRCVRDAREAPDDAAWSCRSSSTRRSSTRRGLRELSARLERTTGAAREAGVDVLLHAAVPRSVYPDGYQTASR